MARVYKAATEKLARRHARILRGFMLFAVCFFGVIALLLYNKSEVSRPVEVAAAIGVGAVALITVVGVTILGFWESQRRDLESVEFEVDERSL